MQNHKPMILVFQVTQYQSLQTNNLRWQRTENQQRKDQGFPWKHSFDQNGFVREKLARAYVFLGDDAVYRRSSYMNLFFMEMNLILQGLALAEAAVFQWSSMGPLSWLDISDIMGIHPWECKNHGLLR